MEATQEGTPPWKSKLNCEFVRFLVVGVAATLAHFVVYWLINALFSISVEDKLALNISYGIGYVVSFVGNYYLSLKWTFKTQGNVSKGAGFALSHLINAGMHYALLNLFLWLGMGQGIVSLIRWGAPWAIELLPALGEPSTLLPFPIFLVVVPLNFLLVRFFLTAGDGKKA